MDLPRIRQMDRDDTSQVLGKPGENVDSYFHPLPGSLSPVQSSQAIEIERKFASDTRKWQSHLANPGLLCCAGLLGKAARLLSTCF